MGARVLHVREVMRRRSPPSHWLTSINSTCVYFIQQVAILIGSRHASAICSAVKKTGWTLLLGAEKWFASSSLEKR
jgi:hypothetical protein